MEKGLMIINLGEAELYLQEILEKLKNNESYDVPLFEIDIQHVITHINTAYNIRRWDKNKIDKEYSKSFDQLIQVPEDKYLID